MIHAEQLKAANLEVEDAEPNEWKAMLVELQKASGARRHDVCRVQYR